MTSSARSTPPSGSSTDGRGQWPSLPLAEWKGTLDTLHRWLQMVGKTRLALAPPINHSWHVTLYLTARGLTTSPMPYGDQSLEVDLDFLDHKLQVCTSDGARRELKLLPRTVAAFYEEYMGLLESLGTPVRIWPVPSELEDVLPFPEDERHRSYDPDAASRSWRVLSRADIVLQEFRGRFLGKCSPVHFFWGAFDLACTRFSGRRGPVHPGGVPHLPDRVVREAYSHECISAGWWPGGGPVPEPAFYSYSYPEPAGFAEARVLPEEAYYNSDLREFVLPYEAVRTARRPDRMLLDFLQTSYEAGADLGGWDRPALERSGA
ncbi:MAG TPA: DUF5996 family protein [Gemmatimonadales bacterium]|nr:DUF5996 family protein [Gemmatimonadales bacterium]